MFESFSFTDEQIKQYLRSAQRDLEIAKQTDIAEVIFSFSYNALIKLAITLAALEKLRVKSRTGHHAALIQKLSDTLQDKTIAVMGNQMRMRRNKDIYDGGIFIEREESKQWCDWVQDVMLKTTDFLSTHQNL